MNLVVQGLRFRYPAQEHQALDGIDLTIAPSVVTWLTGALGSGTSTLLLALAGLAPRITGGERHGSVIWRGADPVTLAPITAGIAYLGPSPGLQLSGVSRNVRDEVAVGPMNLGWRRDRILEATRNAMELVGVTHLAERAPNALSGGETQRVLIAALLATAPHLVLLDEPFSALDRPSRIQLALLLRRVADEGAAVVVSCDDADAMRDVADRVVVLEHGRIALDGVPRELLAGDRLLAAGASSTDAATLAHAAGWTAPRPITITELLAQCATACIPIGAEPATPRGQGTPLIFHDVGFAYSSGHAVLDRTTLSISAGEAVGLFGANGAGKSTLLRLAMALEQPTGGLVETLGRSTLNQGPEDFAPAVGFLFQQPERQLFAASVRAECAVGAILAGWSLEQVEGATAEVLEELDLTDVAGEHPYDLPLPKRRLVALASILVTDPTLLLLDEPTAGLDGGSRGRVIAALRRRIALGVTVLAITHDGVFAHETLDRGLLLEGGQIVQDGGVNVLLDDHRLVRPAALAVAAALGLPPTATRRKDVASVLTSARRM